MIKAVLRALIHAPDAAAKRLDDGEVEQVDRDAQFARLIE